MMAGKMGLGNSGSKRALNLAIDSPLDEEPAYYGAPSSSYGTFNLGSCADTRQTVAPPQTQRYHMNMFQTNPRDAPGIKPLASPYQAGAEAG
jgi:hypothetical protein